MKISASRLLWSRDKEGGRLRYVARLCEGGQVVASITRYRNKAWWMLAYADSIEWWYGGLNDAKAAASRALFGDG